MGLEWWEQFQIYMKSKSASYECKRKEERRRGNGRGERGERGERRESGRGRISTSSCPLALAETNTRTSSRVVRVCFTPFGHSTYYDKSTN